MEIFYFEIPANMLLTFENGRKSSEKQPLRIYVAGEDRNACNVLTERFVAAQIGLLTPGDIDDDYSQEALGLRVDIERAQAVLGDSAIEISGAVEIHDEKGFRDLFVVASKRGAEKVYHQAVKYGSDGRAIAFNPNHLVIAGRLVELYAI